MRRSSARSVLLPPATPPAARPRSGVSSRSLAWRAGNYTLDPIRCTSRSAPARVYPAPNRSQMTSVIPQHQSAIDLWPRAAYRHTNLVGLAVGLAMAGVINGLDIGAVALGGERLQHRTRPAKAQAANHASDQHYGLIDRVDLSPYP